MTLEFENEVLQKQNVELKNENIEIRADYIKFKKNRDDADHERTHIARLYSKVCDENKLLLLRAVKAENDIKPTRESLNLMTAERGRWLRKLRKAGVKV